MKSHEPAPYHCERCGNFQYDIEEAVMIDEQPHCEPCADALKTYADDDPTEARQRSNYSGDL